MAATLGKRKRITREELEQTSRSASPSDSASPTHSDAEDIQDVFRRAFEAKFNPLPVEPKKANTIQVEEEEDSEGSDWSGIESEEDDDGVEVIEHSIARHTGSNTGKADKRTFMSSKPPSSAPKSAPRPSKRQKEEDDTMEASHLKNDLALQRLLRDSHLLSSSASTSGTSTPTLNLTGSQRHKSLDLHIQSLGAKSSIHSQKNMPLSHRKGITAKAKSREEKRRAEAKENGVILEKAVKVKKFTKDRDRGVGGPGVGRFKGGTLKLSRRDVADITGGRGGGTGRGKKGKR